MAWIPAAVALFLERAERNFFCLPVLALESGGEGRGGEGREAGRRGKGIERDIRGEIAR